MNAFPQFTDLPLIVTTPDLDVFPNPVITPRLRLNEHGQIEVQALGCNEWLPVSGITHSKFGVTVIETITEREIEGLVTHDFRRLDILILPTDEFRKMIPAPTDGGAS